MTIRPIQPEIDCGLDFKDFFDDYRLVNAALCKLSAILAPADCYCLRFRLGTPLSSFEPYGRHFGPNSVTLPSSITYDRLVIIRPNVHDDWPAIAEWHDDGNGQIPNVLSGKYSHVQFRLQTHQTYVGYFKAAVPSRGGQPDIDALAADAHREMVSWLNQVVIDREVLQQQYGTCHGKIGQLLRKGQRDFAVRFVCHLLTSHVGAGFNRVAFLDQADGLSALTCRYAHGGDCSDGFAYRIQYPVSQQAQSISDLANLLDPSIDPADDPLFDELVDAIIPVYPNGQSVLTDLWRHNGNLGNLSIADIEERSQQAEFDDRFGLVAFLSPRRLAARLGIHDPAVQGLSSQTLLKNRNQTFFVLPWIAESRLIGLFLLDDGYWSRFDRDQVIPRLAYARSITDEFADHFL